MYYARKHILFFRPLFLLAFLLVIILQIEAQFIFKPKKPIKTNRAWIDTDEKSRLKDCIPFSNVLIIDSRYDTLDVGITFSQYLMLNDRYPHLAWQHIMNDYYHPLCDTGKDTLLIQLEKFGLQSNLISDARFVSNAGYIKARLYKGRNNLYAYMGTVDTILQEKYTNQHFDAHKHGKHINWELWDYYLLQLFDVVVEKAASMRDSVGLEFLPGVTLNGILKEGWEKRDKPILKADSLQHGFYRNFSEFEQNNPTFGYPDEEALKKLLVIMHYRVDKNLSTEAPDTTYWGFCDGKNIYIRHAYDFYQLERKDDNYYIVATMDANRVDGNRAGLNLLIGLATLSTSIAANGSPEFGGFDLVKSPEIPRIIVMSHGEPIVGTQLDWDTGGISY